VAKTRKEVTKYIGKIKDKFPFPGEPGQCAWDLVLVLESKLAEHAGNLRANHVLITSGEDLPAEAFDVLGKLKSKVLYARCRVKGCHADGTSFQAVRAISHQSIGKPTNLTNHQKNTPRYHPSETSESVQKRSASTCMLAASLVQQHGAAAGAAASTSEKHVDVVESKKRSLEVADGEKEECGAVMFKVGLHTIKARHMKSSVFEHGTFVYDVLIDAMVRADYDEADFGSCSVICMESGFLTVHVACECKHANHLPTNATISPSLIVRTFFTFIHRQGRHLQGHR